MLILRRKVGQQIVIAGRIRVTVNRVEGNRVSLGFEAPDDVRILRGELQLTAEEVEVEADPPGRESAEHDDPPTLCGSSRGASYSGKP